MWANVQSNIFPFFHSSGVGVSFGSNVTSGNTIIVGIIHSYYGCPASISDSLGTTYTKVVDRNSFGSDSRYLSVWVGVAGSSAANTVTPTYACGYMMTGFIAEYSGLDSSPYDTLGNNESTSTAINFGSITTAQANELVIGVGRSVLGQSSWTGSSGTIRQSDSSGIYQDENKATAGTVNPSVTAGNTVNSTYPFFGWTVAFKQLSGTTYTQNLNENQSFTDSLIKSLSKQLSETQTYVDSIIKSISKLYTENVTNSDTLTSLRLILKTLSESFTSTDTLSKAVSKTFAEARSFIDTVNKQVSKAFSENQTFTDSLTAVKVFIKNLVEAFSSTDSLVKGITKNLSETQSLIDSLIKNVSKTFTENQAIADTLTKIKVILKTLSEVITYTDTLIKRISKTFTESSAIVDFLTKVYSPIGGAVINIKNYILKLIFPNSTSIKNSKKNFEIRNKK